MLPGIYVRIAISVNGDPALAETTQKQMKTSIELDHEWGLDHGTWSVLMQMYPDADVPVLQLSIDYDNLLNTTTT